MKLLQDLWKSLRREDQEWKQKSRINWLKNGDRNTKFYHGIANGRRGRNMIVEIMLDGNIETDSNGIRRGVFDFFKKHFQKVFWQHPKMTWIRSRRLTNEERMKLEDNFSLKIISALRKLRGHFGIVTEIRHRAQMAST